MEKSLLSLLSIALFANQAASVPAGVTPVLPVKRALPYYTGADTAAPYFIGYTYDGDCEFLPVRISSGFYHTDAIVKGLLLIAI